MRCADCGQETDLVDETASTGREVREYCCEPCDRNVVEHGGLALWQALAAAREQAERDAAEKKKRV